MAFILLVFTATFLTSLFVNDVGVAMSFATALIAATLTAVFESFQKTL